jgi:chemotaxis signal transduction protein
MFKQQEISVQIAKNYWYEPTTKVEPTIECLTFQIGEIGFGVSIDRIHQIFNSTQVTPIPNTEFLDLHHRLFGISSSISAYSIVVNSRDDRLYQIVVDTVPILIAIRVDRIRRIPNDDRTTTIREFSNHVAKIGDVNSPQDLLFILDIINT